MIRGVLSNFVSLNLNFELVIFWASHMVLKKLRSLWWILGITSPHLWCSESFHGAFRATHRDTQESMKKMEPKSAIYRESIINPVLAL